MLVDSGQIWTRGEERPSPGVACGSGGMVASASPTAAAHGLAVLQRGGNAFDAALAVAGVEWLTLPGACGLGGDVFAVLYDARRDRRSTIGNDDRRRRVGISGGEQHYPRIEAALRAGNREGHRMGDRVRGRQPRSDRHEREPNHRPHPCGASRLTRRHPGRFCLGRR